MADYIFPTLSLIPFRLSLLVMPTNNPSRNRSHPSVRPAPLPRLYLCRPWYVQGLS